jgi:hypothetical protein
MGVTYMPNMRVSERWLDAHPNHRFVFGDNTIRKGKGGAAILRDHPQSIGFITKKFPNRHPNSYYTIEEYQSVFEEEMIKLKKTIDEHPEWVFIVCPLGSNLANLHGIWEAIIKPGLMRELEPYFDRCWFLFPP